MLKVAVGSKKRRTARTRSTFLRALALAAALHLAWVLLSISSLDDERRLASPFSVEGGLVLSRAAITTATNSDVGGSSAHKWPFDPADARKVQSHFLRTTGRNSPLLTAYVEPPLPPEPEPKVGATAKTSPLPRLALRTHGPEALTKYEYPKVTSCASLPGALPVNHPPSHDFQFGSNTFNSRPIYPKRFEYAERWCPVDADPFLPWLHDVFSAKDGRYVEFVAQNKRRCNSDPASFMVDIDNLEGQVSLMQPVPLKRLDGGEREAHEVADQLWRPEELEDKEGAEVGGGDEGSGGKTSSYHRYRLASHEDADPDGRETRFICRFHAWTAASSIDGAAAPREVILGETLSVYPYNYELANLRKPQMHKRPMLTRPSHGGGEGGAARAKGGSGQPPHNSQIWNSMLHFRCPVPDHLVPLIRSGRSVVDDVASVYVDIVPVRTYPRTSLEGYIRGVVGSGGDNGANGTVDGFDPDTEWGPGHVLPRVEASGRLANIPVCRPPWLDAIDAQSAEVTASLEGQKHHQNVGLDVNSTEVHAGPRHFLVGCTWASATFMTRGSSDADTTTADRLTEWLTYHLDVAGFSHMYVYDNTGARTNQTSLAPVTDLFPGRVTRIDWPHRVCNNNRPAHSNTGERSSQYAAEASCRIRYGPGTEWLVSFDADEYLIPMGKWTSIAQWLREGVGSSSKTKTNILSFFMTRAHPNIDLLEPFYDDRGGPCKREMSVGAPPCLAKRANATFLEAYDCESTPLPKPDWGWRAKKQIYRPWYVLNHFVHYSVATRRLIDFPSEVSPPFKEISPFERRVKELTEAFMLHAKTTSPDKTAGWKEACRTADKCPIGIPWPMVKGQAEVSISKWGLPYNCHKHEQVSSVVLPMLRKALSQRLVNRGGRE